MECLSFGSHSKKAALQQSGAFWRTRGGWGRQSGRVVPVLSPASPAAPNMALSPSTHPRLRLHLPDAHYLPKSLRDTIQVVSLGATRLDIKGAQVRVHGGHWMFLEGGGLLVKM